MPGLSLITAVIVHRNKVYLDRALQRPRGQGAMVLDDLLAHVAPLAWEHIGLTGDYVWDSDRPLRAVPAAARNSHYVPALAA